MPDEMSLPEFIAHLQNLQKKIWAEHKKVPVVKLSSDEEGNSFGNIDTEFSFGYDSDTNNLIIYPVDNECN